MNTRKTILTEQDVIDFVEYVINKYEKYKDTGSKCENCKAYDKDNFIKKVASNIRFKVNQNVMDIMELKYKADNIIFPVKEIINNKNGKKDIKRSVKEKIKIIGGKRGITM